MTTMQPKNEISQADVESMVAKLDQFAQTLAPAEQEVLSRVIVRAAQAAQAEAEVQGHFVLIELPPSLLGTGLLLPAVQTALLPYIEGSA